MEKTSLKLVVAFSIALFSLLSLSGLAFACDEGEMQNMMTGNSIADASSIAGYSLLLWIKEFLIVVVLVLLIIFLVKKIAKK